MTINKYFGVIGTHTYCHSEECPGGYIEVDGDRPSVEHIVSADGKWVKVDAVLKIKQAITAHRWSVESGGITMTAGVRVATGIEDQNRITSVVANAERSGLTEFDFKAESGWMRVTLAELQGIAGALAQHVQACFSAERMHHEAIDALEQLHADDPAALQQALEAYDIAQGWPTTDLREPRPA